MPIMTSRSPLVETPLYELPLGSIRPQGWLKDQLTIQASGMTGHLDEFWEHVGKDSGWLGGTGESWERGPYYLDGLLPLAYLLDDERLKAKVQPWIEWTLASAQPSGQFGPANNNDWWSRMVMLKVLMQYAEYTNDPRVVPFMTSYFHYQLDRLPYAPLQEWAEARGGENLIAIHWLYNITGDEALLTLAKLVEKQTIDWTAIYEDYPYWNKQSKFDHRIHVVNVAMSLKQPALKYVQTGEKRYKDVVYKGINSVMNYHGQVNGMFSGDEWLAGTHPSQGTELCSVVEYMYTLEQLIRITGDTTFADTLEKVAFNALPAAISADWTVHQYDQQANQVMCTHAKRQWTENNNEANMFGVEPHFGCCTANMHQGWPKLAARLWMATKDKGLAAIVYSPCTINTSVGNDQPISLKVDTAYPFDHTVRVTLTLEKAVKFPLHFRIPQWCSNPSLFINEVEQTVIVENGFAIVDREWGNNDQLILHLPMEVQLVSRANGAIGIQRGPLMYVIPIEERWQKHRTYEPYHDWELYPNSPWNYGVVINEEELSASFEIENEPLQKQPFDAKQAPVKLLMQGRRIPEWTMEANSAARPPLSPVSSQEKLEQLTLIPYGCARLRIAELPVLKN